MFPHCPQNTERMQRKKNLDYINLCLLADAGQRGDPLPERLEDQRQLMRMLMNIRPPMEASERFLRAQDEELRAQAADKGRVTLEDVALQMRQRGLCATPQGPFLWQGDITRLAADAIVNAANAQGLGCFRPLHACIDNCIHSAAGVQLRNECQRQLQGRLLATAEAIITPAYNLPARHVLHVVGPIVGSGVPTEAQCRQLADCYRNCLALAAANGLHSVAFCCISTGVFRFPAAEAARVAVQAVAQWQAQHAAADIKVVFNVFKDHDYEFYRQLLG